MDRNTDGARLVGNCPCNGLANPPCRIGLDAALLPDDDPMLLSDEEPEDLTNIDLSIPEGVSLELCPH